jgi:hypothetical protein
VLSNLRALGGAVYAEAELYPKGFTLLPDEEVQKQLDAANPQPGKWTPDLDHLLLEKLQPQEGKLQIDLVAACRDCFPGESDDAIRRRYRRIRWGKPAEPA